MDVELLSRIIRELITDHDEVSLPSLGVFVAEMVPASFSDRGYTINPPYRRLSFVQRESGDTLLVDFYARSNRLDPHTAETYLTDFFQEMRKVLEERKTITLPGLGRLRATRENALFFVPEEGLDIFPDGFGLKSVSLKHIPAETDKVDIPVPFVNPVQKVSGTSGDMVPPASQATDDVSENQATSVAIPAKELVGATAAVPEAESTASPAPTETPGTERVATSVAEPAAVPSAAEKTPVKTGGRRSAVVTVLILLGSLLLLAGVLIVIFLILANVAPDFIDSILYTPEELRIINY